MAATKVSGSALGNGHLYHHHIGPPIGKLAGTGWPGAHAGQVYYLQVRQGVGCRHKGHGKFL
jgi:hypothetical protein